MKISKSSNSLKLFVLIGICGLSACGQNAANEQRIREVLNSDTVLIQKDSSNVWYVGKTFQDGMFSFCRNQKCGFIDIEGREVIAPQYDEVKDFSDGLARVEQGRQVGFIDKTGKMVIPFSDKYEYGYVFRDGLISFKSDSESGFMDKTGQIAFLMPQGISATEHFKNGLVKIRNHGNGKYGLMDTKGNIVAPTQYDMLSDNNFSDGLLRVSRDDLWGYIDKTGKEVIVPQYRFADNFEYGRARVEHTKYIDKTGKELPLNHQIEISADMPLKSFRKYRGRHEHDLWGFEDINGKEVIPAQYIDVEGFSEGLSAVLPDNSTIRIGLSNIIKEGTGFGYIDKTGNMVIAPQFSKAEPFNNGLARVSKHGREFFINKQGKTVIRFFELPDFNHFYTPDELMRATKLMNDCANIKVGQTYKKDGFSFKVESVAMEKAQAIVKESKTQYQAPTPCMDIREIVGVWNIAD
ncbi:MAG: WG repeat-containing protein [Neisseriaceae bacterium]|nr:WG repeat-containing protein [Neisseriaceae bacterium]